jgi:hypothetical protein
MSDGSLGSLVVSIQADHARFTSDMGKVVKANQDAAQKMTTSLESVTKTVTRIGTVLTTVAAGAGFAKLIQSSVEWNLQAAKVARTMGITSEQASVMNVAMAKLGIGQDVAESAALRLSKTLATGTEKFDKYGIKVKDSNGNLLSMPEIMGNVNQKLLETHTGTERNIIAMDLYGRSWKELQSILKLTPEQLREAQERAERLHLIVGPEGAAQARAYKEKMNEVELVAKSLSIQLGNTLLPTVISVSSALADNGTTGAAAFGKAIAETVKGVQQLGVVLGATLDKVSAFGGVKGVFGQALKASPYTAPFAGMFMPSQGEIQRRLSVIDQAATEQFAEIDKSYGMGGGSKSKGSGSGGSVAAESAKAAAKALENYTKVYNDLQDARRLNNPYLTAEAKEIQSIQLKYQNLIGTYPEHRAELQRNMELDLKQISIKHDLADALEAQKKQVKWFMDNVDDMAAADLAAEKFQQVSGSLGLTVPKMKSQKNTLMGGVPSLLFGEEVNERQAALAEMLAMEKKYQDEIVNIKFDASQEALDMMRSVSEEGSAIALAALVAQKAIAVAQIMWNTEVAASAAIVPPPVGLGPNPAGFAMAELIRTKGYLNAGLTLASGVIEGIGKISGKRATGGPVSPYGDYIVGEEGPEVLRMGPTGGHVYPNKALGGNTVIINQTNNVDARGADAGSSQRIEAMLKRNKEETKAEILNSMNRGGTFARASGRV